MACKNFAMTNNWFLEKATYFFVKSDFSGNSK